MYQKKLIIIFILILISFSCSNSDKNPYEDELKIYIINIDEQKNAQLKVHVKLTNLTNRQMKRIGLTCFVSGGGKDWEKRGDVLNEVGKGSLAPNESVNYTFVFNGLTKEIRSVVVLTGFIHYFK